MAQKKSLEKCLRVQSIRRKLNQYKPGSFVSIPLSDGSFAYGRVLEPPYVAFYNFRTQGLCNDLDEIDGHPILFRQCVQPTQWEIIGIAPLMGEASLPVVTFRQSLGDYRKCVISDSLGNKRDATPEECIGLERVAAWEPHHVEQRLLDTFMGRPNVVTERLKVKLS